LRLRPPWLLLKASLSVYRTNLLLLLLSSSGAARWELFGKQRIAPWLLSVVVLVQTPVVLLLSVLVELVVLLLSVLVQPPVVVLLLVLIELVARLLSVLVELLLVVLVESLLLSVVVLRELLAVVLLTVVLLTVVLLTVVLLTVVLLTVVLLTVVLLTVVLLLFTVTEGTNVDVSGKTWNILSPAVASDGLWHPPIRHSVLVQDGLRRSVSESTSRTGAAIATIAQIPSVALTSGVGRPGAISCTNGINILPSCAVKPAAPMEKGSGTITGDSGAKSGDLLFHPRLVLNTTRDVRPCSIVLAEGDIVSTSRTDNLAGLPRERL